MIFISAPIHSITQPTTLPALGWPWQRVCLVTQLTVLDSALTHECIFTQWYFYFSPTVSKMIKKKKNKTLLRQDANVIILIAPEGFLFKGSKLVFVLLGISGVKSHKGPYKKSSTMWQTWLRQADSSLLSRRLSPGAQLLPGLPQQQLCRTNRTRVLQSPGYSSASEREW